MRSAGRSKPQVFTGGTEIKRIPLQAHGFGAANAVGFYLQRRGVSTHSAADLRFSPAQSADHFCNDPVRINFQNQDDA